MLYYIMISMKNSQNLIKNMVAWFLPAILSNDSCSQNRRAAVSAHFNSPSSLHPESFIGLDQLL